MFIIIPSIRNINTDYIRPLLGKGNRIIVVDDTDEERIRVNAPEITVLHYSDRKKLLGEFENCIPKKNGVCRDFGLLAAYHLAQDDDTIVCLDDDCEVSDDYQEKAEQSLGVKSVNEIRTSHKFYNPLDLYMDLKEEIFPRGYPYEERLLAKDYSYSKVKKGNIVFNLGLWKGVFDVNAVDKLYLKSFSFDKVKLKYQQVIIQKGSLVSLCSMNMIMKKELIPAIYQLPMNEPIMPNWRIDRYGDIWGGYICKKLIDIKGDCLSIGEPLIYHHKDGNLNRNILQEHYGHIVNLRFCEFIDKACVNIKTSSYLEAYIELVNNLKKMEKEFPPALRTYLVSTIKRMQSWVNALQIKNFKLD